MKAVLHTCRAMHTSLPGKADVQQSALCHCERASGHLWSSLNVSGATCDPTLNHVSGALLASLEVPTVVRLVESQRLGKQPPAPKHSLLAQGGSLFSPGGRHAPPIPFLASMSPRTDWPGLYICSRQRAQPPRPCRPALEWAPPPTCTQHSRILLAGSCGAL